MLSVYDPPSQPKRLSHDDNFFLPTKPANLLTRDRRKAALTCEGENSFVSVSNPNSRLNQTNFANPLY